MKNKIKTFILLFIVFSLGLFFGELFLDIFFGNDTELLSKRIRDSILKGLIVSILFLIGSRALKMNNQK